MEPYLRVGRIVIEALVLVQVLASQLPQPLPRRYTALRQPGPFLERGPVCIHPLGILPPGVPAGLPGSVLQDPPVPASLYQLRKRDPAADIRQRHRQRQGRLKPPSSIFSSISRILSKNVKLTSLRSMAHSFLCPPLCGPAAPGLLLLSCNPLIYILFPQDHSSPLWIYILIFFRFSFFLYHTEIFPAIVHKRSMIGDQIQRIDPLFLHVCAHTYRSSEPATPRPRQSSFCVYSTHIGEP